jgi:hypothetical protein
VLAGLAKGNGELQDAIILAGGVPPLLAFIRIGSSVGQEHAGRAIWHLCADIENQKTIVRWVAAHFILCCSRTD